MENKKKVIIIGAGVAGLTAALELLRQTNAYEVIVLEEEKEVGGIARTLQHNGNKMDIGGHRFFSKDDNVMKWWLDLLPLQGSPSKDEILLGSQNTTCTVGPDPEKIDEVMLQRRRISRILYLRKFFDYPISLKPQTFINMGLLRTIKSGFSYIISQLHKKAETSLENFMINRFGRTLYRMFFEDYTEKLWGRHPSQIDASWGKQRIKGLSLSKTLYHALISPFKHHTTKVNQKDQETSLIEQFIYPKYGPGQLWQKVADEIIQLGGTILCEAKVVRILKEGQHLLGVEINEHNENKLITGDIILSSMPIKDFFTCLNNPNRHINAIAQALPYRDFITVGILVDKLKLRNNTKIKTVGNNIPDTWIYVQERDVKLGRIQIFNNWSPYLVDDFEHKIWLGLEYFCDEGDFYWQMSDEDFIYFAESELIKLGIVAKEDIKDAIRHRIKKAYPAYFGSYKDFDQVKNYLDTFDNLYCIGRNGQHRYNNMDHSMVTAFQAVKNILTGQKNNDNIWSVNTEKNYHEIK